MSHTVLHQREAEFHDAWADSTAICDILVRESFESPTAMANRFILGQIGELQGKSLLDIGAGLGESSVYFALQGANVTTVDLSPRMVEMAVNLGRKHGVKIEGIVSKGEDLKLPSGQYDLLYIANTIHHVQNRTSLFEQMSRVLKPGGKFFSCDPLTYNPVINVYRRMASRVRTVDESPLTIADLELARKYFCHVQHREFWIAALALFLKYYAFDQVHPNQDRYWNRMLRETSEQLGWWKPLKSMDSLLTRIPLVRWLAWYMVMWGEKAHEK